MTLVRDKKIVNNLGVSKKLSEYLKKIWGWPKNIFAISDFLTKIRKTSLWVPKIGLEKSQILTKNWKNRGYPKDFFEDHYFLSSVKSGGFQWNLSYSGGFQWKPWLLGGYPYTNLLRGCTFTNSLNIALYGWEKIYTNPRKIFVFLNFGSIISAKKKYEKHWSPKLTPKFRTSS